jgi:hypothetical protein
MVPFCIFPSFKTLNPFFTIMATRDDIKAFVNNSPMPVLAVPTPELPQWDGQIFVRRVCARALASHWKDAEEDEANDERAAFVSLVASDKDGSRIFQDEDVLWLSTTPLLMPLVERLYWAGRQHNGLTEENRTAWRKNLGGTGDGGLPSSCAAPSKQASALT